VFDLPTKIASYIFRSPIVARMVDRQSVEDAKLQEPDLVLRRRAVAPRSHSTCLANGIAVAVAVVLAACGRGDASTRALPLTDALLAVAQHWGQGADRVSAARAELDRIAARVREHADSAPPHLVLAQIVFQELGFVREVEDESLDYVFLPSVLAQRRGSCVGLGSLYLALAEQLGWRMHGVMLPAHFFVVLDEQGVSRSIELLHHGEAMPDGWHRARFTAPAAPAYARALTRDEVVGVVEFDVGNQRKREGRLQDAQRAYESARRRFPDFAEAHASVGAVAHMLGVLDYSLDAYREAQRVNPELPGLAANLALLTAEREHGRLALPPP
jgi:tetratricopeptide (TPR) repeat protein